MGKDFDFVEKLLGYIVDFFNAILNFFFKAE